VREREREREGEREREREREHLTKKSKIHFEMKPISCLLPNIVSFYLELLQAICCGGKQCCSCILLILPSF
jgi:hypothetical protein